MRFLILTLVALLPWGGVVNGEPGAAAQKSPAPARRPPAPPVEKTLRVGVQASYGDDSDLGIGGRAVWDLPVRPLLAIGTADYFFPSGSEGAVTVERKYWELNGNVAYGFGGGLRPYVGTGLNLVRGTAELSFLGSPQGSTSETKLGLNLLAGVMPRRRLAGLRFFGEARYEVKGGEQFVATLGILF